MVTAELVDYRHIEGRRGGAFLNISSHVEAARPGAMMDQLMDHTGIAGESEDYRRLVGEDAAELLFVESMRMVVVRLQGEQIDDVHHAHAQVGRFLAQQPGGRHHLLSGDVSGRPQDYVRLSNFISPPAPTTSPLRP